VSPKLLVAKDKIKRWYRSPLTFVREVFGVEPDAWQRDVLEALPTNFRIAMKACKGPGKTCLLAWIIWWFLVTRPYPKIVATSITSDNLGDGLWTEMAKWQRHSSMLTELFEWTKTRIFLKKSPEEWWVSARTWPRNGSRDAQADTLAGLHADYLLFVLDEAGGIPDAVMAAAEAGLANARGGGGKEAFIIIAGNPTHLEGPLFRASTSDREQWHVTEITGDPDDPKRSPRISVEWANEQIKKYGRDNPWVLVNVFGRFPPSSINTLLGPEDVRDAQKRYYREHEIQHAGRIVGVDVAREGDDLSVIFPRQGQQAFKPMAMRNASSLHGAGMVARLWKKWDADACFVDGTGGFGAGWLDQLQHLQFTPIGIHFAGKANDEQYANKRAEMWFLMSQWILDGGALPDVPELVSELSVPTYTFKGDKFIIEPKDLVKARLMRSPDYGDGLALTFAQPVARRSKEEAVRRVMVTPNMGAGADARRSYDPFARANLRLKGRRR